MVLPHLLILLAIYLLDLLSLPKISLSNAQLFVELLGKLLVHPQFILALLNGFLHLLVFLFISAHAARHNIVWLGHDNQVTSIH